MTSQLKVVRELSYDGSIKIDTKVDSSGFSSGIENLKSVAKAGVTAITATLAGITTAIVAGGTAAVQVGSSFESAMSKVSAISGATGDDLQALTDKAKEMGATTKFSASESAEALQYMAMAGWDTASMLDGISGIMSLAAADGLDLATTSDIVTDALTAFGLQASDSTHFADVLAKTSSSANTNVSMLGESFKYVAPLAGTMGYSVEDVSVALGLMANASIKGSQAGTSLKTALANLAAPTNAMAQEMKDLGISLTDDEGNSKSLIDVLKNLRSSFSGLSDTEQTAAASTIFGKEAMSGMLAIINASDSDFTKLVDNINNADGAAQSMADTMQNNLQGQITILKSGLEGLGIEIYESMSQPLTEAAVEAQEYVSRLTDAFKSDGLTGLIEEAGNIFGELAVKAAEQAPKMIESAISFLTSFCKGISDNKSKLISAAKSIVDTIVNNLVKLLPSSVQQPVKDVISAIQKNLEELIKTAKDCVKQISQSFKNGGLKSAVETVRNIIVKLSSTLTSVAKTVLPLLVNAVDLVAGSMKIWLPIITAIYTAYKAYSIISTITALISAQTAAVTAESLAEAASTGAITLKQIAVGLLTGEITLATAAQWAWNIAMDANPIGLVIAAVAALAAGITALCFAMGETEEQTTGLEQAQASLEAANQSLGESYEGIGTKFTEFLDSVSNAGSIFDNFNEEILISDEDKQALDDNMSAVQQEITQICKDNAEERKGLTDGEIQRLEELFQKMHELSEQELAIEQAKQGVVISQAKALNEASDLSLDEYTERSLKLANTAEETRVAVIDKAEEQYFEEVALLDQRLQTDAEYSQKQHDQDVKAAEETYQNAIDSANKTAADTIDILEQGYIDRADVMADYTEKLSQLNDEEAEENQNHATNLGEIESEYYAKLKKYQDDGLQGIDYETHRKIAYDEMQEKEAAENQRHTEAIAELRNKQQKYLDNENYQNQVGGFAALEGLYETYAGKTNEKSQDIVNAFYLPMKNMPEETKTAFADAVQGGIDGLSSMADSMYNKATQIASSVIGIFTSMFDEHSPSKVFKKIFKYTLEGGEGGLDDEAPNLYKTAESIGNDFTQKLKGSVSADGLVSKMRAAVSASRAVLASNLTASVVHDVNVNTDENNRKVVLKGDIKTSMTVDGREIAVATAPYMSEEMAWGGEFA
jgi:TP901 family phage tail tape measure protein